MTYISHDARAVGLVPFVCGSLRHFCHARKNDQHFCSNLYISHPHRISNPKAIIHQSSVRAFQASTLIRSGCAMTGSSSILAQRWHFFLFHSFICCWLPCWLSSTAHSGSSKLWRRTCCAHEPSSAMGCFQSYGAQTLVSKLGKWSAQGDEGLSDQSTDAGSYFIEKKSCCPSTADASETDCQTFAGQLAFHAVTPLSGPQACTQLQTVAPH